MLHYMPSEDSTLTMMRISTSPWKRYETLYYTLLFWNASKYRKLVIESVMTCHIVGPTIGYADLVHGRKFL